MLVLSPTAAALLSLAVAIQQPVATAPNTDSSRITAPLATHTAIAVRATDAPRIDGRDDDAVWREAPSYDAFRQFEPRVDADPRFRTVFRAAYDDRNLYVFVRMFDPHPDSIMHALSRRDVRAPSDQIKLLIDSYDDKRTGYELAVNPDGVKRDYSISNDSNEDDSWNGIWDVATQIDSLGWTAEFRVPLSQLRYANADHHTFGFGIWRDIERYRERTSWPLYTPSRNGLASQLGRLTGISGIAGGRRLELTPYVVTKNVQRTMPNARFERAQEISGGADLKFGITPNVVLDATVNPDFGQVETDPAVVNLSAFETFLQERRPFFVEGTALYQFQLNCYIVVDCSTNEGLFYSRRIGRSPTLRSLYGNDQTAIATPIAVASKLTGRTRQGLSFGILDAYTRRVTGTQQRTVEPGTNYAVVRAQQELRGGEAELGFIGTGVHRGPDSLTAPFLHGSAYAGGVSFRNRFHKQQYELAGQFVGSRVTGTPEAITRTQLGPVHYYQQPGDRYAVDSSARALAGHGEQLKFGKYGGGITRFETSIVRQSIGLEANDLGFLRRADRLDWSTWGALSWREARGIYRWAQVNGNHWETWNTSGDRLDNALNVNGHMGLLNNWDVHLGGTLSRLTPSYCDRCTRGGPLVRESRAFSPWGGFNTDSRRLVSGGVWMNLSFSDEGRSRSTWVDPYVTLRVSSRLTATASVDVGHNTDDAQWIGNYADPGSGVMHYAFAHLRQRTIGSSIRVNYTLTPDATFELYAQPFVSEGRFTDVRELSATPRAPQFAGRYTPYTPPVAAPELYKSKELRTNAVLRWEYAPGSTVFIVWTHGRHDYDDTRLGRRWERDYQDLFAIHPDNTFLIKLAYWIGT